MLLIRNYLLAAGLAATSICIVGAQVNATKGPKITASKPAGPKKEPAESTFGAEKGPNVEWSYLRVNRPGALDSAYDLVKKGQMESAALAGLLSPQAMKTMGGGNAKPLPGGLNALLKPGASGSGLLKTAPGSIKSYLPLEVSPRSANFGNVIDGQRVQKAIYVRNAPRGMFLAKLESKYPFRIVSLKALDGRVTITKAAQWEGSLVRTGRFELSSALKTQASQANAPKIGAPGLSKPAILSSPSLLDTRVREATSAPFQVESDEGTTFRIVVEFAPKWSFNGDPVGNHDAKLMVACGDKSEAIDLHARFEGVNVGVIAVPDSREFTILASTKYEKHPKGGNMVESLQDLGFTVELSLANPKEETEVRVWAEDLPSGVSLVPTGHLASNGTDFMRVSFKVRYGYKADNAVYGLGQEIILYYSARGITRQIPLTFNFLPDMRTFRLSKRFENINFDLEVTAKSDGWLAFSWDLESSNAWPQDVSITFLLGSEPIVRIGTDNWYIEELNGDNKMKTKRDCSFKIPVLAEKWEQLVFAPQAFRIKVFEHL